MKAVILAGGLGTRITEETHLKPKPMIEIGGKPILWHLMKIYAAYGICEFIICLGYKGYLVKEYFANYFLHTSNVTFDLRNNSMEVHQNSTEPWVVTLVDTGEEVMTGGRLKRVKNFLEDGESFCFTYGDGLADLDIPALIAFHKQQDTLATVTAVQPPGRFGSLNMDGDKILDFNEKPLGDGAWVSGGFFILEREVIDYIEDDHTIWEKEPMMRLAQEGNMSAFCHRGFWRPMDTLRDKIYLEDLWQSGEAPWQVWKKEALASGAGRRF